MYVEHIPNAIMVIREVPAFPTNQVASIVSFLEDEKEANIIYYYHWHQ